MTVFCDNGDCCHIGEDGFCGCDKLSIVGGVCAGSYRSGRNACDGDVDERLKAENAKLIVKLNAEHIVRQNVEVENAKLRELLKNALTYIEYEGCGVECPETGNSATLTTCDVCNRYETESCAYVIAQSARELRIEVK